MKLIIFLLLICLTLYGQHLDFASELTFSDSSNGYGPVERNLSNGENGTGDGNPITMNGVVYAKGLGVHAPASVTYTLNGNYTRFIGTVGIDDETFASPDGGTVIIQLWGDGNKIYDSGLRTKGQSLPIRVSLVGITSLEIRVTDGGDGVGSDHVDIGLGGLQTYSRLAARINGTNRLHNFYNVTPTTGSGGSTGGPVSGGRVLMGRSANPQFDPYLLSGGAYADWLNMRLTSYIQMFPPTSNPTLTYYHGKHTAYLDLYGLRVDSSPDMSLVLKDMSGNPLYLNYGCESGCYQYAADPGLAAYRTNFINRARTWLNAGYEGLWIDDANVGAWNVSNVTGQTVCEQSAGCGRYVMDPRTGVAMTYDNWRKYMTEMLEAIRAEFPNAYIIINPVWYAGPSNLIPAAWTDTYITRSIRTANLVEIERGIGDSGLTGNNTGQYSVDAWFNYVQHIHALGVGTINNGLDCFQNNLPCKEYEFAATLLGVSDYTKDHIGDLNVAPDNSQVAGGRNATTQPWGDWFGYDVVMGAPTSPMQRNTPSPGVYKRTFKNGVVYLLEPNRSDTTISLGGTYRQLNGTTLTNGTTTTSITLTPKSAKILLTP